LLARVINNEVDDIISCNHDENCLYQIGIVEVYKKYIMENIT